ncbi:GNAT family N-acetyltransferase [Terrilactibacillus sp. BCM23-1]|uniref:GNAT family N-acetyltransferase n=1 Tax=Terrilactibacillus tamarindi TaxID=2599694 RepID=A0A6N8CPB9_9BACI|nr:GNAT family protein [Terrilactibacillus tamarindi]MTT30725.1 GNAT family N-acetyltransferase [Terrilactibacillus tamarindi]
MSKENKELRIRPIVESDLQRLWELAYKEESPEWKKWDAPYYPHHVLTLEEFLENKEQYISQNSRWAIDINNTIEGTVSYYWEHKPSLWLEMGICIYNPNYWNGGYGTKALKRWIDHLFQTLPLVRVGFTTWSGNHRMMKLGKKLGMTLEARLRKCRYYNGKYYDSIRMGLLREEWEDMNECL